MGDPLTTQDAVEASLTRPLTSTEQRYIETWIVTASSKLRHACPWDIDQRVALYKTAPADPTALDPDLVADVLATVIKRFLVNIEGVASSSEGTGPYSASRTYVNRYDKTGSDVRGAIQVTESDIDQLRPAVPTPVAGSFQLNVPAPRVVMPNWTGRDGRGGGAVVPDIRPGFGAE